MSFFFNQEKGEILRRWKKKMFFFFGHFSFIPISTYTHTVWLRWSNSFSDRERERQGESEILSEKCMPIYNTLVFSVSCLFFWSWNLFDTLNSPIPCWLWGKHFFFVKCIQNQIHTHNQFCWMALVDFVFLNLFSSFVFFYVCCFCLCCSCCWLSCCCCCLLFGNIFSFILFFSLLFTVLWMFMYLMLYVCFI